MLRSIKCLLHVVRIRSIPLATLPLATPSSHTHLDMSDTNTTDEDYTDNESQLSGPTLVSTSDGWSRAASPSRSTTDEVHSQSVRNVPIEEFTSFDPSLPIYLSVTHLRSHIHLAV